MGTIRVRQVRHAIKPGQRYRGLMPHSEVCMSMKIAGRLMDFELQTSLFRMPDVQLYDITSGAAFSAPILVGEAGVYHEGSVEDYRGGFGFYYYPPVVDGAPLTADDDEGDEPEDDGSHEDADASEDGFDVTETDDGIDPRERGDDDGAGNDEADDDDGWVDFFK